MGWVLRQSVDWFVSQRNSRQRQKKQKHSVERKAVKKLGITDRREGHRSGTNGSQVLKK
jgi:hypothetical protein